MRVLITGGAGYIGSHTLLSILQDDHEVCVYDNYCNSSPEALRRVQTLTNRQFTSIEGDIRDESHVEETFNSFKPDTVIHFAGLKAVGESVEKPALYYENNVQGTISLIKAMEKSGCNSIVFSSSATVYGDPEYLPYDEQHRRQPTSPYGWSKMMVEQILEDWCVAHNEASAILLRYFNPVGAHESGDIGEDPNDIPNNLMPFVSQVAVGRREKLMVFGDDYDTPDGTGVRDYIHVSDLAAAHVAAMHYSLKTPGCHPFNIGTGTGSSVLDVVKAFERASGQKISYEITNRRSGDIGCFYANPAQAEEKLGWRARYTLDDMCLSAWNWQSKNPQGYIS